MKNQSTKPITPKVKQRLAFYAENNLKTDIIKEATDHGLSVSGYLNMVIRERKEFKKNG